MKKLLMCSAAVVLGLAVATPAKADGIKLDLAGHFMGYVDWATQDTSDEAAVKANVRHVNILRETEIHFTGETTLDNGLTVGVHHDALIDNGENLGFGAVSDLWLTRESYAYFSGAWGRVNFGKGDGANYLLEVAAPSADTNYDGLRQHINPFSTFLSNIHDDLLANNAGGGNALGGGTRGYFNTGKLDYSDDASGFNNKITYLTPVWNGFQAGASYTPDMGGRLAVGGLPSLSDGSRGFGSVTTNNDDNFGSAWEGSARYEGKWQELGITLGGGYTHVGNQADTDLAGADNETNFHQWNLGAALTWQQFGLGGVYTQDNGAIDANGRNRTWVGGIDYTTGPFKLGASYLNNHEGLGQNGALVDQGTLDTTRWAGGVIYTYGPGMTFRGSVGWVRTTLPSEQLTAVDTNKSHATDVLLGTQINF